MRTLTTLQKIALTFKVFTVNFSVFYAICVAIFGGWVLFNLNVVLGLLVLLHAIFVFLCGQSIGVSLIMEDRKRRWSDESS